MRFTEAEGLPHTEVVGGLMNAVACEVTTPGLSFCVPKRSSVVNARMAGKLAYYAGVEAAKLESRCGLTIDRVRLPADEKARI